MADRVRRALRAADVDAADQRLMLTKGGSFLCHRSLMPAAGDGLCVYDLTNSLQNRDHGGVPATEALKLTTRHRS